MQRIDDEQGALHVLVNDIWGATTMEWDKTVWESSLDVGLRTLRLAVDTHAITTHFALPLLIRSPGGLVVEVTDGTDEYNAVNYRVSFFYDMAKAANRGWPSRWRTSWSPTARRRWRSRPDGCGPRPCSRPTASPSRTGVTRRRSRPTSPSPRAPPSSAGPWRHSPPIPNVARWNGQSLSSGQLAKVYGFTDLDGSQPDAWRYVTEVQDAGKPADTTGYR